MSEHDTHRLRQPVQQGNLDAIYILEYIEECQRAPEQLIDGSTAMGIVRD